MAVHNAHLHEDVEQLNRNLRIALVVAEFNETITSWLLDKNLAFLTKEGFDDIDVFRVPWCFELPPQTKQILDRWLYSMVITLWCVIKWETPHFDYVCEQTSRWIMDLWLTYDIPLIFWVLTCDSVEQAEARVDHNYAIYALNYVAQHWRASLLLDQRYEEITSSMSDIMEELE